MIIVGDGTWQPNLSMRGLDLGHALLEFLFYQQSILVHFKSILIQNWKLKATSLCPYFLG